MAIVPRVYDCQPEGIDTVVVVEDAVVELPHATRTRAAAVNAKPRRILRLANWIAWSSTDSTLPEQRAPGAPYQSQCPVGSTAFQLVLNSFGSTGRFGLTRSHDAPSGVVGRALLAAHWTGQVRPPRCSGSSPRRHQWSRVRIGQDQRRSRRGDSGPGGGQALSPPGKSEGHRPDAPPGLYRP